MSAWAKASRTSKRWERDQGLVFVCRQTSASRVLMDSSGCKRLSRGPIVVELALPILAHKPDATLHPHRLSSLRLELYDSWLMLMYKRWNT